jgi:predicted anti-sigma-YlaC factor YlaD
VTNRSGPEEERCIEFVERVTDYLDGAVKEEERHRIDEHLEICQGCRATLDQFQTLIRLAGRLTAEDVASLDPLLRDRLMATLRIPRRR